MKVCSTMIFDHIGVFVKELDYGMVSGRNCDNCVGYVPVPVGVAGPLRMGVVGEGGMP